MTKKVNAEEFRKRPRDVYEAADSGETVLINHDRYRKVFELTARDREPLKESHSAIPDDATMYDGLSLTHKQAQRVHNYRLSEMVDNAATGIQVFDKESDDDQ